MPKTPLRWTGGQAVPPGYMACVETRDTGRFKPLLSGEIDRHVRYRPGKILAIYAACMGTCAACSRIRRVVLRHFFLPGRADPDPSGSSRMSAPCGRVGAVKVWRNLVGHALLCKCQPCSIHITLTSSHGAHDANVKRANCLAVARQHFHR